jgi:hypothetical protein
MDHVVLGHQPKTQTNPILKFKWIYQWMYRGQTVGDPEKILTPDLTPELTPSFEFQTHSNRQNQIYRNLSSPSPLSCFLRQNSSELRRPLHAFPPQRY